MGKNFTNPTSDRGLASKKYKKLKKLTSTKPNNPIKKISFRTNSTTEEFWMAKIHLNKCSKFLVHFLVSYRFIHFLLLPFLLETTLTLHPWCLQVHPGLLIQQLLDSRTHISPYIIPNSSPGLTINNFYKGPCRLLWPL